jgi:hypothetical protein
VAPAARQGSTAETPSGEVRLARGLNAPSGEVRLARRLNAPSGGVRLARGLNAPSGGVRLARGLNASSSEDRLARGHLHARRPRFCPRVRAFNAPTPQDAHHDPGTPGSRAPVLFHRLPGEGHPRHGVALCDEASVSPVTMCAYFCTANAPSPRRGGGETLECFSRDYTGLRRDVRPAGAVFPVAVNPVRPSPPLQRQAGHCDDIHDAVGVQGDRTSPRPPLCRVRTPR